MTDIDQLLAGLAKFQIRGGHDWYRISAAADGDTEALIEIYDEIGMWGVTAADFTAALAVLPASVSTINLRLNTPGGSLFDGLTIANRLREHRARVNVTVDGLAASIGSVIAMAGDQITMARGSQMMIHNPSAVVRGTADDMDQMADLLRKVARDSIAGAYKAKAGGSLDDWLDRMDVETWYSAGEAVAVGLADAADGEDDEDEDDEAAARTPTDLTVHGFRYPGRDAAPDPLAADTKKRSDAVLAAIREDQEGRK